MCLYYCGLEDVKADPAVCSPLDFSVEYLTFALQLDPCALKDGEVATEVTEVALDEMSMTQAVCNERKFFD